jgi:predicted GNAT family N-acyltransferase
MLELAETESRAAKTKRIVLHAQTYALPLYEAAGFRVRGTTFRDAGIEHIAMEKRIG